MKHWKLSRWCAIAVKKIRYTPDREAVYEELRQHLDERSDSFLEQGFDEEAAVQKTMEVMGDPNELTPVLAAIHRPFWGYAYSIARTLAVVTPILALVLLLWNSGAALWNREYKQPDQSYYTASPDGESKHGQLLGLWPQTDLFSFGGYIYHLEKCALWETPAGTKNVLYTRIRITNDLPWAASPDSNKTWEAVDNLGNYYTNTWLTTADQPYHMREEWVVHTAPFEWQQNIIIYAPELTGVEWIELRSRNNPEFTLRIDLTGGDIQ